MNGATTTINLKKTLTCSNCAKILKDPIVLPCDDCICREHLTEKEVLKQNKIKCVKCQQEFKVKGSDFKSNKLVKKMLDHQIHLSDAEKSLKQNIEESIQLFYKMYDEYALIKSGLDFDCHEHFQEMRFQIDEHREKFKEKIDDIYMEMIEQTKEFEATYLKSLKKNLETLSINSFELNAYDDDLKEVEETFRDPNLRIESIQEVQRTKQDAIEIIQAKLSQLNQIKYDLKVSNEFKPNVTLDPNTFGQFNLNAYSSDIFKSQILTCEQPLGLIELCEFSSNDKFKLLYRASRDGFSCNDFHSKCDGKCHTLSLFKVKNSSFIFGAFTSVAWDSSCYYKPDPHAFLFSLTNKDNKPCKMRIDPMRNGTAIHCCSVYGPIFGGNNDGHDIFISSNANKTMYSYSNLGSTYKHPQYAFGTNEAQSFLAGSYNFLLSEIEVYQKMK